MNLADLSSWLALPALVGAWLQLNRGREPAIRAARTHEALSVRLGLFHHPQM